MKLRSVWLIRFLAAGIALVAWCWLRTLRLQRFSVDGRHHPADANREQYLYAFWHEGVLGPLCDPGKIKVLISQHADGEWIAQICQWLGLGVIRGSTTRGGCGAIQEMIGQNGAQTHLGITPDGPRGPRRQMQPGAVWVASTTGIPVVLLGVGFAHAWRASSWDRLAIPVPGSTLCAVLSQPMQIPSDLDRAGLDHWRKQLEDELQRMNAIADAWAERIRREGRHAAGPTVAEISRAAA
jgi:lysophospholipid acyltransferase (LPLAT)-like uncharacterized protein